MKRLIYCLDGTSNIYDAEYPTNVVIMHKTISPNDGEIKQIAYYDAGVGTKFGEVFRGGVFGYGLFKNIIEAYQHLCENYELGDEIYIFGFSRGAYTARSFAGLIGWCGILDTPTQSRLVQAQTYYKHRLLRNEEYQDSFKQWRLENCSCICANAEDYNYRKECVSDISLIPKIISIKYIGIWDTVRTLGITDNRYRWHNHDLSHSVKSARHAIALDERRKKFNVTLWDNIEELNNSATQAGRLGDPYQQMWFPGTHGSVGGGGLIRGLSDNAFEWIRLGAEEAGLSFIEKGDAEIFTVKPNALDWLDNGAGIKKSFFDKIKGLAYKLTGTIDRKGPSSTKELDHSVMVRFFAQPNLLPEKKTYRPGSLNQVKASLENISAPFDEADYRILVENNKKNLLSEDETKIVKISGKRFVVHTVEKGETLSGIAKNVTGDLHNWNKIHEYNQASIPNPDLIYIGQRIFIPLELISDIH